jgi:phosphatidylglycerol:prolipoprotein diacylglycerol transferase
MLEYPTFNPVAFQLGPLSVHWYGLMYLLGFLMAWLLAMWRTRDPKRGWTTTQASDLIFYCAIGLVVGARMGYMLFYNFFAFIAHPFSLFALWQGGMSFHGGLLGIAVATLIFSWPLSPLGLAAGRLGNFINGELWGRTTTVSWGMIFPNAGILPRHPSQLYELIAEGFLLFIIVWTYSAKIRPRFAVASLFLLCYGAIRIFLEFFREPDASLGFIAWHWLTMGQLLSLPMIMVGGMGLFLSYHYKERVCSNK